MVQPFVGKITVEFNAKTDKFHRGMKDAQKKVGDFENSARLTGIAVSRVGSAMAGFGTAAAGAMTAVSAASAGAIVGVTRVAMDFETAFTNVIKVLGKSDDGFKSVAKGIRDMTKEIPMAAEEIAGIAEAAARLGVPEKDIIKFTRTVADLGVTTNMAADEAAEAFARFANITGMSLTEVDRLGSTVVHLGNNLATSEREITAMGLRIAAAGRQAGLSEAEIMGFAGAISATGIRAEAGGTAFTRVLQRIKDYTDEGGKKLQTLAKVSGMSAKEFADSFNNDPAQAVLSFITGLGDMEKAGKNTSGVLKELSFNDIRVKDTLNRAAGASHLFTDAINMSNTAWKENTALSEEAQLRYSTLQSQLQIMKNRLMDIIRSVGIPFLDIFKSWIKALDPVITLLEKLAKKFEESSDKTKKFVAYLMIGITIASALAAAFFGLIAVVGGIIAGLGLLIAGLGTLGIAAATIGKVVAIIVAAVAVITGAVIAAVTAFSVLYARSERFRQMITEQMNGIKKVFKDVFEQIMGTFKDVWAIVKQFWQNDLGAITDIIMNFIDVIRNSGAQTNVFGNAIVKIFSFIRNVVVKYVETAIASLTTFFKAIEPALMVVAKSIAKVRDAYKQLGDAFKGIIDRFKSTNKEGSNLHKIFGQLNGVIQAIPMNLIMTLVSMLASSFAASVRLISNVIDVVGHLIDAFKALFKLDFKGFGSALLEVLKSIGKAAGELYRMIWDTVAAFLDSIINSITGRESDVTKAVTGWFSKLVEKLKSAYETAKEYGSKIFTPLIEGGKTAYNYVADFVKKVAGVISNMYNTVKTKLNQVKELFSTIFGGIKGTVTDAFKILKAIFSGDLDEARRIAGDRLEKTKETFSKIFDKVKEIVGTKFKETVTNFITKLKELPGKVKEQVAKIPGIFAEFISDVAKKLQKWIDEQTELNNEFYGSMLKGVTALKERMPGSFSEAFELVKTVVSEKFTEILDKVKEKLSEWKETFTTKFDELKQLVSDKLTEWKDTFKEKFDEIKENISNKLTEWRETFSTKLEDIKGTLSEKLTGWRESVSTFFTEMPGRFTTWFSEWKEKISTSLSSIKTTFTDKLDEWKDTVKGWFTKLPDTKEIKTSGKEMIDKVAEGNEEKKEEFMEKLGRIIVDVLKGALILVGVVALSVGRELITRMATGFSNAYDRLKLAVLRAVINAVNSAKERFTNYYNTGRDFIRKMAEGVTKFAVRLYLSVTNAVKEAWRKAKEFVTDFYNAGKDVFSGFVRGMGSMLSAVKNKAKEIARGAWDSVKSFFGIKSPSRLMISGGKDVGAGFIIGMNRTIKDVRDTAERFAEAAIPNLEEVVDLDYATPNGTYGTLSSAIKGTVEVNNREERLIAAVENLGDRIENMEVVMESRTVGGIVAPYVKETNERTVSREGDFRK